MMWSLGDHIIPYQLTRGPLIKSDGAETGEVSSERLIKARYVPYVPRAMERINK